ncbi:hypothetical protein F4820DRAFT_464439 [Hypoxylon rubiginosum]|uniref:Uncharacterized protein n=1 Tax=Hypoxylon rubiginosum TaxID=110542 RepID=A0ACB9YQW5_9PEZI|nr:hypothetical protein F4820DRAFT_464439 [Hypoxylon rubiginosum]
MHFSIAGTCRFTALVLYSAQLSSAYWLHSSCEGKHIDKDKLSGAISNAMNMAAEASQDWDKNEVQDLKTWIFGSTAEQARQFVDNIYSNGGDPTFSRQNSPDKINFFCDLDELEVTDDLNNPNNPSGKKTHNKAVNMRAYGDGVKDCESTDGISGIKGYTANFEGRSYIVLCPWYLDRMNVVKVPTSSKFLSAIKNPMRALDKALDSIPDFSGKSMDTMFLLDQTILHEITHTTYAGHSRDIDGGNSYTWENVIRLSSNPNAWKNAESLAFFGLGVDLIRKGYTIQKSGNVKKT